MAHGPDNWYEGERAVKAFKVQAKKIQGYSRDAAFAGTVAAAEYVADYIRNMIGVQGTRDDRSLPGEPPKRQSGELQNSIRVIEDRESKTVYLVSETEHWFYLEYGTKRMQARPFWRRAIAETRVNISRVVRDAMDDYVRSHFK